ncbi:MAG: arginine--tRNA ligase [Zetaproteobacteria bacterium]|nr:arginine--tRNA ligase [Zetaproteobacteria bacterium]
MKQALEQALQDAVDDLLKDVIDARSIQVKLSRPKMKEHGDYACNVAMPLASVLKLNPRHVAEKILAMAAWPDAVDETSIAGPGFINIRLQKACEAEVLKKILSEGKAYGQLPVNSDSLKVCLEFVSANPTGPMHVGHGRGAVVGDALGRLLSARGFKVHREYYINDAGTQIGVLANSVWLRMCELQGQTITLPESAYPGDYIIDIARDLLLIHDFESLQSWDEAKRLAWLNEQSVAANMRMIGDDLAAMNIQFDSYFSEKELHESGKVQELIQRLKDNGTVYLGTLPPPKGKEIKDYKPVEQWLFRTTDFGDDVDRPLAKKDGTATYFAADIAYHENKFQRGFDRMIDIWGADHGGYVTRVRAAMKALTQREDQPDVLLIQMVNLTRDGKPVKMSKRAGTFVTLREVVDEVGSDAVRFNFMTRRVESQFDFDLEEAKEKSSENPVYYVQYAHARVAAILRKSKAEGVPILSPNAVDLSLLIADEEQQLIANMLSYGDVLAVAADRLEAYRVATYVMKLAADFHSFYHKHRVVTEDENLTQARLLLVRSVKQVIFNALFLLGVSAPEEM